ncbi:MAG: ribonuclease Y [Candidatus Nomurabacteria bacterium]|nr:MAG: ribonuclease Y [Candidatus Nomurabacteria bacterium]
MIDNLIWILLLIVGIPGGIVAGYYLRKTWASKEAESADAKATLILEEAKTKQRELLVEAKDRAIKLLDEAKREENTRRQELQQSQQRLERREATFDQKLLDIENRQSELTKKAEQIKTLREELTQIRGKQIEKLEKIAELTKDEGREVLLRNLEDNMKEDLLLRIRKLQNISQESWEREAKQILSTVLQRVASSHVAETTTTVLNLPSDEMKGRIIGREGRNIKTIEQLTGVEIIVDETPESIVISGFNPIRRHVAKRALEKLIQDGRIHPSKIEDAVEQAKKDLANDIQKAGEEAAYEVGVAGLDPKLIQLLGRLKYRTSYGQNVLRHSIEVSLLAGVLAAELGANVSFAKKGGLLHDIGKALDHEIQGTHMQIGYDIMKKFGLPEEVAYIAHAHHEDNPQTLEGAIVKVADAISGARPGARKDTYEQYVTRLQELEDVVTSFDGVEKAFAIQAGREVRIFVNPDKIDDYGATQLARNIAKKIETDLNYPGEIKVNMLREKRIITYAR